MNTIKTILFVGILGLVNLAFLTEKNSETNTAHLAAIEAFSQELCEVYNSGQDLILVNKNGQQILNPNKADLENLAPEFMMLD